MKYYSADHECIWLDGEVAYVGISKHAAEELGDITYVELPEIGHDLILGDTLGVVESVKAASDVYAPASGTVIAVNERLVDDPGLINVSPEDEGWICKLDNIDHDELDELMNEEAYAKYLKEA
ncbi:MAG: glycine cleavage system protein H [Lentisphaerae bacterium GWF2_45_14]|nr:MAG: glycine cleavage system protein H [Lentisphaerae bacterium GWF2_45_14]